MFATPQEAQNAIDTFDGWELDGRIIKVRRDRYQGSTSQPSPQLVPDGVLSSPQMMHAQLSPSQTPNPNDYVAMVSNQPQQNWQSQFLGSNIRPMQPMQSMATQSTLQLPPTMQMNGQFLPTIPPSQFANQVPPGNSQVPPGPFTGVLYNTQGGQWYPNYGSAPALAPQVRLPSSADTFTFVQQGQSQNGQLNRSSNSNNDYGI